MKQKCRTINKQNRSYLVVKVDHQAENAK
jgi:hypothetical protein